MIAALGHGGQFAPAISRWIVHTVGANTHLVPSANCVNLALDYRHCDGAKGRGQWSQLLPTICSRVVNRDIGYGIPVLLQKSAEAVNLAIESDRAYMVQTARHWRAFAPGVGCRVVLFIQRLVDKAVGVSAKHVHFAASFRYRNFRASVK